MKYITNKIYFVIIVVEMNTKYQIGTYFLIMQINNYDFYLFLCVPQ